MVNGSFLIGIFVLVFGEVDNFEFFDLFINKEEEEILDLIFEDDGNELLILAEFDLFWAFEEIGMAVDEVVGIANGLTIKGLPFCCCCCCCCCCKNWRNWFDNKLLFNNNALAAAVALSVLGNNEGFTVVLGWTLAFFELVLALAAGVPLVVGIVLFVPLVFLLSNCGFVKEDKAAARYGKLKFGGRNGKVFDGKDGAEDANFELVVVEDEEGTGTGFEIVVLVVPVAFTFSIEDEAAAFPLDDSPGFVVAVVVAVALLEDISELVALEFLLLPVVFWLLLLMAAKAWAK